MSEHVATQAQDGLIETAKRVLPGGTFGNFEISAADHANLLVYYLFAMKYGEYMQQPETASPPIASL